MANFATDWNITIKKGSNTVFPMTFYDGNPDNNTLYDITAFDTAELIFIDERDGVELFTITGTLNTGSSTASFTIAPADTADLEGCTAFVELKLSNSGDATIDRYFAEGNVEFVD